MYSTPEMVNSIEIGSTLQDNLGNSITNFLYTSSLAVRIGKKLSLEIVGSFNGTPAAFDGLNATLPGSWIPGITGDALRRHGGIIAKSGLEMSLAVLPVSSKLRFRPYFVVTTDAGTSVDPVAIGHKEVSNITPILIDNTTLLKIGCADLGMVSWSDTPIAYL